MGRFASIRGRRGPPREGWDPESVRNPLWVRDDAAKAYVPLTAAVAGEIREGTRRL